MPWFAGCRCCHVTTRKLDATTLRVKWNGDWGETVRPDSPKPSKYPNDVDGSSITLTDIAVDSAGRVWNTGTVYTEDTVARVYQVTAKEFAAKNGRLTGRTFDWNEDVQGDTLKIGSNLNAVAVNSLDEIAFGGNRVTDDSFGSTSTVRSLFVDQTLSRNDPLWRDDTFGASQDTSENDAELAGDGIYSGGESGGVAFVAYRSGDGGTQWTRDLRFWNGFVDSGDNALYWPTAATVRDLAVAISSVVVLTSQADDDNFRSMLAVFPDDGGGSIVFPPFTTSVIPAALGRDSYAVGLSEGNVIVGSVAVNLNLPTLGLPDDVISLVRAITLGGADNFLLDYVNVWEFGARLSGGGVEAGAFATGIATDSAGNIYLTTTRLVNQPIVTATWTYNPAGTIDGAVLVDHGTHTGTLWKLDPDGMLLAVFDHGETLRAVTYRDGFIYVCGDRANGGGRTTTL